MAESLRKILIADESQHIREILRTHLVSKGYDAITCDDGEDALHLVYEKHPDLIILDIHIPGKNGYQVCRQIKSEKAFKEVFVILLSSKEQKEDEVRAKECGANEFLSKPFLTSEIEKIIQEYFTSKRERSEKKMISIDEEIKNKKKKKKPYVLCCFELGQKSSSLFEQKYGEIRYSEMIDKVIETLEGCGKELDENMILEREDENKFVLLLEGKRKEIQIKTTQITKKVNDLLKELHEEEDYKKGFIRRNVKTDKTEKAPPVMIKSKLSFSRNK